jgi:hypothetical protein
MQPLSELWMTGHAPLYLRSVLSMVRLMGAAPLSGGLRMAWNDAGEMRAALAKLDA